VAERSRVIRGAARTTGSSGKSSCAPAGPREWSAARPRRPRKATAKRQSSLTREPRRNKSPESNHARPIKQRQQRKTVRHAHVAASLKSAGTLSPAPSEDQPALSQARPRPNRTAKANHQPVPVPQWSRALHLATHKSGSTGPSCSAKGAPLLYCLPVTLFVTVTLFRLRIDTVSSWSRAASGTVQS